MLKLELVSKGGNCKIVLDEDYVRFAITDDEGRALLKKAIEMLDEFEAKYISNHEGEEIAPKEH